MPQHGKNGGNGAHGPNGGNGHELAEVPDAAPVASKLPDTWDRPKVDKVLRRMIEGESVRNACLEAGLVRPTFMLWVVNNVDGLAVQYARAREAQVEAMEAEIIAIADDSQKDTTTRRDAQGNEYEVPDNEWIARSKLRVDTRRWIMSKIAPKKYGDRTDTSVNVGVGGTGTPIVVEINPFRGHRELMAERVPLNGGNGSGNGNGDGDDG